MKSEMIKKTTKKNYEKKLRKKKKIKSIKVKKKKELIHQKDEFKHPIILKGLIWSSPKENYLQK